MIKFYFLCCFTIFGKINLSYSCTPVETYIEETQEDVDNFKKLIQVFQSNQKEPLPVYNNATVPNHKQIIEQFKLAQNNEDITLNFSQLVTKYGYPLEEHRVVTEDGYCLTLFRIPNPGARVVFLMHGLLGSSDDFITGGLKVGLAYVLSRAGYDVWLGNARGNRYSRCHLKMFPYCKEFWQFSFEQIGYYDLPTMIDYSLKHTGRSNLAYIGHSQGTTAFYVMASMKPEYNDKISIMIALSAVVIMGHVRSPLFHVAAPFVDQLDILSKILDVNELLPRDALVTSVTSTFCGSPELATIFCQFFIMFGCGFNYAQLNITALPVVYGHYPAGASTQQALHYTQGVKSGKFQRYDHGYFKNLAKYGSFNPPEYPLAKVTCPMAIFYSHNDWLTSAIDIYTLVKILPNMVEFYHVPCASFNHFDYIFAKDGDILINREVMRILDEYAIY